MSDTADVVEFGETHRPGRVIPAKLAFTAGVDPATDDLWLSVTHDQARTIYGHSGRDSTHLSMPPEFWASVIPAVLVRLGDEHRVECLKRIQERLGQ